MLEMWDSPTPWMKRNAMETSALDLFVSRAQPHLVPVVIALDDGVNRSMPLDSAIKWRQLVFAVDGDYHHWLCAIAASKKRVTLNFHFGALLDDHGQEFRVGSSKFMRMLDYETVDQVDAGLIATLVSDAASKLGFFRENWQRLQKEDP
jgi:hypothetical protein